MKTLSVCSLIAIVGGTLGLNPGLELQLNQNALTYFKSIGIQILNKDISGMHLPDVSGVPEPQNNDKLPPPFHKSFPQVLPHNYFIQKSRPEPKSLFNWWLSSIVVNSFSAQDSSSSILISPPGGLIFNIGSVSGAISADYKIKVGTGWLSVTKTGTVDITLNAAAHVNAQLSATNGHPQVSVPSNGCSSSVSNLDITFHGDIIDDILDLFKGAIEGFVSGQINGIICSQLTSLTASKLNPLLNQIPLSINLIDGFALDYALTGNPQVVSNTIMVPFLGRLWYTGHHDDPQIPQAHPMGPITGVNEMLCFQADAEEVVGSLGYAGQVSGMLHLDVDQALLASVGLSNLLKCDCGGGACIGTYIPAIKTKCPANGSVGLLLKSTQALNCAANTTGLFLNIFGEADIYATSSDKSQTTLLALNVTASAVLPASTLSFDGWTIKGQVHATGATISVISSQVGTIPQSGLDTLWKLALILIFEEEVNKITSAGIKLPQIPDINILQPNLSFGTHTLQMCANVQYTGPI